jgi:hypothetical protein
MAPLQPNQYTHHTPNPSLVQEIRLKAHGTLAQDALPGPGWFESSQDLIRGLEVCELTEMGGVTPKMNLARQELQTIFA